MGSQEPLWAVVSQLAKVISTSCVLVPKTVYFSRTGRCTVTNTGILSVQRYERSSALSLSILGFYFMTFIIIITLHFNHSGKHHFLISLHYIDFSVPFQVVTGKGFEVQRRVYVDFEGINLRRKFLTGLEPESITMTIGNNSRLLAI